MTDHELLDKAARRLLDLIERLKVHPEPSDADESSSVYNVFDAPSYAVLVNRATNTIEITVNE